MNNKQETKPMVVKETKNKIHVDYEGKLSLKERMMQKLKASNTWIKGAVNVFRFIMMLGVSFVILYPFVARCGLPFHSASRYFVYHFVPVFLEDLCVLHEPSGLYPVGR